MPNSETIRFKSPEEIEEEEIKREFLEKDEYGYFKNIVVYREKKIVDPETGQETTKRYIYFSNPYEKSSPIIRLETDATREDIEAIKREIIPMKESFEILMAMAMTYKLRQPLLIEGPTAIGKTYLAEKFTELLYGRGVKPLDFYCSGQTDVSELMGKWVPRVETEEERRKWEQFLKLPETQVKLSQIAQEVEQAEGLSQEQKLALIHTRLQELARSAGLSERTQWRFQYGAVPKAMGLIRNPDGSFSFDEQKGTGFILHIQEVGLAEPQVINALLKLRGERGQLAEEIQLWENGGKKVKAGPKFWVLFSTNPPEEYLARNEVDPALARGVVFKRMGELSKESLRLAAIYYFTYRLGNKPGGKPEECILDIYNHPDIGIEIAEVIAEFHNDLNKALKPGEKGRQQRIPLTLDDMARVADALIYVQIRDKKTGRLDLTKTIETLIRYYYIDRMADPELKETMMANLKELLEGDTGKKEFEGKILTRKEIFDILVERASITEEEKKRLEQEEIERKQRKLEQAKHDAKDAIEDALRNPNIPEEIKELLRKIRIKIFESPSKETMKRGEILDFLLRMERIHGIEIKDVLDIHSQPDGTLFGKVQLSDGRWVLFKGYELLENIGGKKIQNAKDIHLQPDGTLAGRVQLSDGRWVPFIGNKLLENIGGEEIKDVSYIHSRSDGTLVGIVRLYDDRWLPFIGTNLLENIGGKKILNASYIHLQPDGTLVGIVQLSDYRWVPFIGDKLLENIGGEKIYNALDIHLQPDGTLVGIVQLSDDRRVPFKGDELLENIGGEKIYNALDIHSRPDGTLVGIVLISNGRWVPFIGDKLLENIGGKEIKEASDIHSQPDGTLAGRVQLSDGRWVPFIGNNLLENIGGKKIQNASDIHSQPDGTLAGRVQLSDGRWVPFIGKKLLENIGGKEIKDSWNIHLQPDGTLAGAVQLSDKRWVPFIGDKLLENVGGKEIQNASDIHLQPDGTLAGRVQLSDGRWVNFFWDGERVYLR
jgi:MoxR-like ATPase